VSPLGLSQFIHETKLSFRDSEVVRQPVMLVQ